MSSPYQSPAYRPQQLPAPRRRIPGVYWALLVAACLLSLAIGYAIGEYVTYLRINEAVYESNPNLFDT